MALVTQNKNNLSGGVNQQGAVHRHSTQVEEMINCVPTLDAGTKLRNSTARIEMFDVDGNKSETITFPSTNKSVNSCIGYHS